MRGISAQMSSMCLHVCADKGSNSSRICQYSGWPGVPVGNWILQFRKGEDWKRTHAHFAVLKKKKGMTNVEYLYVLCTIIKN